jgi:putative ABC transport system permease protein
MWPGQSALGQKFLVGQAFPERRVTVVGVVAHLRLRSLVEDLTPQIFIPFRVWQRNPMAFVVRTGGDPAAVATAISAAVARFDPQLPIYDVREMSAYLDDARAVRRFTMVLTTAFALSAVVLTCIGVYGVLAYAVTSRRHEFGVRRALGASRGRVIRQILGEGLGFAVIGCATGLICALLTARLIQAQLYAIAPRDPITYAMALAIVLTGATLACLVPACRAIAVSPMDALRSDS